MNQVVISETFNEDILFTYDLLTPIQIEKRNKWQSLKKLYFILKQYDYKKIIYGGYSDIEERIFMFLTPKAKNCMQFESSILESKVTGVVAIIKKIFFNRFSVALPSGELQTAVFKALGYRGEIIETKGVGIFNKKVEIETKLFVKNVEPNYIYVGRLIEIKNLRFLIEVFNTLNKPLTIVGSGVLDTDLKQIANSNIKFTGFVDNNEIHKFYESNDVFVLPSFSEPWGLVVEEAIYNGLPVLVSDSVGCQEEMVIKPKTGIVFSSSDQNSLIEAITAIEANMDYYKQNCKAFDFDQRDTMQINSYIKLLSL
jgi:glycosyltransferase involved in cell wall biosynthesis